jgi:hypothetical protein
MSFIHNEKDVDIDYESFAKFVNNETDETSSNSEDFHPIVALFYEALDLGREKSNKCLNEEIISFPIVIHITDE